MILENHPDRVCRHFLGAGNDLTLESLKVDSTVRYQWLGEAFYLITTYIENRYPGGPDHSFEGIHPEKPLGKRTSR